MVTTSVCHGNHLGDGNGHTNTNNKRNIGHCQNQGSGSQMSVTNTTHHGCVNQVQRHLGQFTHDDGNCQLNRFKNFGFFPVSHTFNKACKLIVNCQLLIVNG